MKKIISLIALVVGLFVGTNCVFAETSNQYGSTPSTSISIDKFVGKPEGNTIKYVDNLSVSDYKFSPNNDIYFQIKVKNTANVKLYNIIVKDFLPEFIDPIEGPGDFDFNNHLITINAGDFDVNEEKMYILKARIYTQDKLPADKGLFCETNSAEARNDKVLGSDQASFCFEKQVSVGTTTTTSTSNVTSNVNNVVTTPIAGPEQNILIISLASLMAYAGFKLRKIK